MGNYHPIHDVWILARPKVKYFGAYPSGFLQRARDLLGVGFDDPILHVCSGKIGEYPFRGLGPNDRTLDLDIDLDPDYLRDARDPFPTCHLYARPPGWPGILIDPPYSPGEAANYAPGSDAYPEPRTLLRNGLEAVRKGGKVGILHRHSPRPPKEGVRLVAIVGVFMGYENDMRAFTVYERL